MDEKKYLVKCGKNKNVKKWDYYAKKTEQAGGVLISIGRVIRDIVKCLSSDDDCND